MTEMARKL